jgi:hypothetical protein
MPIGCTGEGELEVRPYEKLSRSLLRWERHRLPRVNFVRGQIQCVQFFDRLEPAMNHSQF